MTIYPYSTVDGDQPVRIMKVIFQGFRNPLEYLVEDQQGNQRVIKSQDFYHPQKFTLEKHKFV